MQIFNRRLLALRRERFASISPKIMEIIEDLYLAIFERLSGSFPLVLHIGFSDVEIRSIISNVGILIDQIINADIAYAPLQRSKDFSLVIDLENLPFKNDIFDLIISVGNVHSINKVEKFLLDIKNILKPNGIFIAKFVGGDSLIELRKSLAISEEKTGIMSRISPFIDVKSAGKLMQNAGFGLPISENDIITVKYHKIEQLFTDLKSLAETNILSGVITPITRQAFNRMKNYYKSNFFDIEKQLFDVTLNIITITGIKVRN